MTQEEHEADMKEWLATRDARLRDDNGWLTLCALDWLEVGDNVVGADQDKCRVKVPVGFGADELCTLTLSEDSSTVECTASTPVRVKLTKDAEFTVETKFRALSDADADGPTLFHPSFGGQDAGDISFWVIRRGARMGIRMKNRKNEVLTKFTGVERWPNDVKYRVAAKFTPHAAGTTMLPLVNALGMSDDQPTPGTLSFELCGAPYELQVCKDAPEDTSFFVLYGDQTNGTETYGMRYMSVPVPTGDDNMTVIDFNKGYNPPCAFTSYATCALPPSCNRLKLRIEAGEKMYGEQH